MDKRKPGEKRKVDQGLIMEHRIPHIQSKVETVAYSIRRPALSVHSGSFKYGQTLVLHNLNMYAKEGTIYCLVGASNTGKSTILSCITGQRRLCKGEILVFGSSPNSPSSGIPGKRIGFMPQELSLHKQLTIVEALQYFGRMYGMTLKQVDLRSQSLASSLDLQHLKTPLNELSPGLQKRASLACALVHDPELIVLDEPTSGMDILFQKGIWMHLQKLVSNGRTSVILTTKNVEEARQAHRVGVLRNGRLLLEDSPSSLLHRFGTQFLAEVVAKLSIKETIRAKENVEKKDGADVICIEEWSSFGIPSGASIEEKGPNGSIPSVSYKEWVHQVQNGEDDQLHTAKGKDGKGQQKREQKRDDLAPYPNPSRVSNRFRALFIKEFLIFKKSIWRFLISILVPFLIIAAANYCIGNDFKEIKVGVVNLDTASDPLYLNSSKSCMMIDGCTDKGLTCRLLDKISPNRGNSHSLEFVDFESIYDGQQALNLNAWNSIHSLIVIENDFAQEVFTLAKKGEDSLNISKVNVIYGGVDLFTDQFVKGRISYGLKQFAQELMEDCVDKPVQEGRLQLAEDEEGEATTVASEVLEETEEPSSNTGPFDLLYGHFFFPGVIVLTAFFTPLFLNGIVFLQERNEGLVSRAQVAGVKIAESLFLHFIYQIPSLIIQVAILTFVPIYLFSTYHVELSALWQIALLIGIIGLGGTFLSFLLCSIFSRIEYVWITGILSLMTATLLSGTFWPTTSQHWILQWVTYFLPWTRCIGSLRALIDFNGNIMDMGVWMGYVIMSSWVVFYLLVIILVCLIRYCRR